MGKTEDLIKSVLADKKLSGEKVYRDEPLIFTASQMKSYTPPEYLQMKQLISDRDNMFLPAAGIFLKQAKFMASFEDNFEYRGDFAKLSPTYRDMNNLQLRGYFSWRTKLRRGEIEKAPLSFAFVYIYELLNLVGVSSAEEGFSKLNRFYESYGSIDRRIIPYLNKWLTDYAAYYALDPALLCDLPFIKNDTALLTVMDYKAKTPEELTAALDCFSSYQITSSAFYKKNPQITCAVVYRLFCILAEHYENDPGGDIIIRLFAKPVNEIHRMFEAAVFYEPAPHPDCDYKINGIYRLVCENGNWRTVRFHPVRDKAGKLGSLLKNTDYYLRKKYGHKSSLKPTEISELFKTSILRAIEECDREKREREKPVINIDLSKLEGIRAAAEITRDKLIVDEPEEEFTPPAPLPEHEKKSTENDILNPQLTEILITLINGKNAEETARKAGIMLSVAVDEINETLFDSFGDTVIMFDGAAYEIIEDYLDELKGMFNI